MRLLGDPNIIAWIRDNAENLGKTDGSGTGADDVSFRDQLRDGLSRIQTRIQALGAAWNDLPTVPQTVAEHWNAGMAPGETLRGITYVLIFLFVGAGLEWLYWQYFQAALIRIEVRPITSLRQRFGSAVFSGNSYRNRPCPVRDWQPRHVCNIRLAAIDRKHRA